MNVEVRFALFCAVMGPGIVTAFADNDACQYSTFDHECSWRFGVVTIAWTEIPC